MASPDVLSPDRSELETKARDLQPLFRELATNLDHNQDSYNTAFSRGGTAAAVGGALTIAAGLFTMGAATLVAGAATAAAVTYMLASFIYKNILDKRELDKAEEMWTTFSSLYRKVYKERVARGWTPPPGADRLTEAAAMGNLILNLILIRYSIYDLIVDSLKNFSKRESQAGELCRNLANELEKMVEEIEQESRDYDKCWRCSTTAVARPIPGNKDTEPLFSSCWEINAEFSEKGGRLCKPGSEVVLTVPPGAVKKDQKVTIYSAVCVDLDLIYKKLNLSENEQIVSPLVEYFTPDKHTFDLNVAITLPHFLPSDVDLNSVKVYHVHYANDKKLITFTEIKRCDNSAEAGSSYCYTYNRGTKELQVHTNHFRCFFCVFFNKDRNQPKLYMRGYGTLEIHNNCQHVRVYAYLWDQRIILPDFCKVIDNRKLSSAVPIELSRGQKNSKLQVQFDKGEDQPKLQHYKSATTKEPMCPEKTEFLLYNWIGCKNCSQTTKFSYKPFHWHLLFPEKHQNVESLFVFVKTISSSKDSSETESTILELVIESESKHREIASNSSLRSSVSYLSLINTSSIGSK